MAVTHTTTTVNGAPHTSTSSSKKSSGGSSGDSQVAANQAAAAKLGISIPGVGGSSSAATAPHSNGSWIDQTRAPGDTHARTANDVVNEDGTMSSVPNNPNGVSGLPGAVPTNPVVPTQVQNKINGVGSSSLSPINGLAAPTPPASTPPSKYAGALAAAQASGAPAPADAGAARYAAASYIPESPADTSGVDTFLSADPGITKLMQGITQLLQPAKQSTTLLQDYNKLYKQSGLDEINQELIDADTVINGTEDDIRNEIQGAGGFGTDSQVQAMSLARNKGLLKRYNQLVQMKTDATNQLNTMSSLNAQDKQLAQQKTESQINALFKLADFRQQATNNIKENFKWAFAQDPSGFYTSISKDPARLAQAESIMGTAPGGLKSLADSAQQNINLERSAKLAQIEASRASTASSYSTIAKNNAETADTITAKSNAIKQGADNSDLALTAISKAMKQTNSLSSGLAGMTAWISGTPARNLESQIKTVQASLSLDQLAALKAASPNGASGLGAASDREGDWLSSRVASLDIGQDPAQLRENLGLVQQHYVNYLATLGYGYDAATGTVISPH